MHHLEDLVDEVVVAKEGEHPDACVRRANCEWVLLIEAGEEISSDDVRKVRRELCRIPAACDAVTVNCLPLSILQRVAGMNVEIRLFRRTSPWACAVDRGCSADDANVVPCDARILQFGPASPALVTARALRELRDLDTRLGRVHDDLAILAKAANLIDAGLPADAAGVLAAVQSARYQRRADLLKMDALLRAGFPAKALLVASGFAQPPTELSFALLMAQSHVGVGNARTARDYLCRAGVRDICVGGLTTIDRVRAIALLAECDLLCGFPEDAAAGARRLLVARPDYGPAWLVLVDALIALGDDNGVDAVRTELGGMPGGSGALSLIGAAITGQSHEPLPRPWGLRLLARGHSPFLSCSSHPWKLNPDSGYPLVRPSGARVSLTMIVRDEAPNLAACLEGIVDLVDEIVVVDTGSADRTREIAETFGARVHKFEWCDDFAVARNFALERASGAWVFVLDGDDRILASERAKLRKVFHEASSRDDAVAFAMRRVSLAADGTVATMVEQVLLFRRQPNIRWEYPVHEQITPSLMRCAATVISTQVAIVHLGYRDPQVLNAKGERNLTIIKKALAERPSDPFLHFCHGTALFDRGEWSDALASLEKAGECAALQTEIGRLLAVTKARAHAALGQETQAIEIARHARLVNPTSSSVALCEAELLVRAGRNNDALEALAGLPVSHRPDLDTHHARATMLVAELLFLRHEYVSAERLGRDLVRTRPAFGGGWFVLTDALLSQRKATELADVCDDLRHVRGAAGALVIVKAALAVLNGDADGARIQLEAAANDVVGLPQLHVALERLRRNPSALPLPFASCSASPWVAVARPEPVVGGLEQQ